MLADHFTVILGQQLTLCVYPETQNGVATGMERMEEKHTFTGQNMKQLDCLASGIVYMNTMFLVLYVWFVAELL